MSSTVIRAEFRKATEEEVRQARGGTVWQTVSYPWKLVRMMLGTYVLHTGILNWREPTLQTWCENFAGRFIGLKSHHQNFLNSIYSAALPPVHLIVNNSKIANAFFRQHRNDELFASSLSFVGFLQLIQKTFPDEQFTHEDFMLTCSLSATSDFRTLLHHRLKRESLTDFFPKNKLIAKEICEQWKNVSTRSSTINITEVARLYTSRVITQLFFGTDGSTKELSHAVNFINEYTTKERFKQTTPQDDVQLIQVLQTFKNSIMSLLNTSSSFFENKEISETQKKALIFVLFFAGQETTASLITYMLWFLANNSEQQEMLHKAVSNVSEDIPQELERFFNTAIRNFTPAYGVGRRVKEDICLEYQVEGDPTKQKLIFFKNETVSVRIASFAASVIGNKNYNDWFAFGAGVHHCPGEKLAMQESLIFVAELLNRFYLTTQQTQVNLKAGVTLQFDQDIFITLKPRNG